MTTTYFVVLMTLYTTTIAQFGQLGVPASYLLPRTTTEINIRSDQVGASGRAVEFCECSPTSRGYPPLELPECKRYIERLRKFHETPKEDLLFASRRRLAQIGAKEVRLAYSWEGLVNLDAFLRPTEDRIYCAYYRVNGNNIYFDEKDERYPPELRLVKACDQIANTTAPPDVVDRFSPAPVPGPDPDLLSTAIPIPVRIATQPRSEL